MKFCLYLAAAMFTLLVANPSHAQNVRGTVTGNAIQLTITGGYLPVTYLWSNGSTQAGISDLPNGRYCVTVTDALCGTASACFDIEEPCDLFGGFEIDTKVQPCQGSSNGVLCGVQNLGRNPPRGATIATYAWSTGETSNCIEVGAGTYSVTVTDQRGCVGKRTITLGEAEPIVISETVTEACKTSDGLGAIQLNVAPASGTYTYAWSNGATTQSITGLQPATYAVTVTNSNGCTASKSIVVGKADMTGDVTVGKVTNNTECSGRPCARNSAEADGAIELDVLKPRNYNYSWTGESTGLPNTATINDLCPGFYTVTVSIANVPACSLTLSESICCCFNQGGTTTNPSVACNNSNPPPLEVALEPKSPSSNGSNDGEIRLTIRNGTGRNKIRWTLPDNTMVRDQTVLTGLNQVGRYCVNVTDGCKDITECVELEFCSNVSINISEVIGKTCDCTVSPDCNAGRIQLTSVTGGITPHKFKWSNGKTTRDIDNLPKGNYTVTVTTASGCSQTKAFTVGAVATTFALNTTDCRYYDEICPINNKVVKMLARAAPVARQNVYYSSDCTIKDECINGQKMLVESLLAVDGETKVINGQCVTLHYCKSIGTQKLYPRGGTNIGFREEYVGVDRNACPGEAHFRYNRYCGNTYVGYRCEAGAFRNGEVVNINNDEIKNKIRLFELLDSFYNGSGSYFLIHKDFNEKTTVAEFEKLMSETQSFDMNDLVEYKPRNTFINTSEKAANDLKVFPNPFNQSFTIEIDNQSVNEATISVYNSLGQSVISNNHTLTKGKNVITIDAKQLNESIYIVEVIDEKGGRMSQKILKSNR